MGAPPRSAARARDSGGGRSTGVGVAERAGAAAEGGGGCRIRRAAEAEGVQAGQPGAARRVPLLAVNPVVQAGARQVAGALAAESGAAVARAPVEGGGRVGVAGGAARVGGAGAAVGVVELARLAARGQVRRAPGGDARLAGGGAIEHAAAALECALPGRARAIAGARS